MRARVIAPCTILVLGVLVFALGVSLAQAAPSSLLLEVKIPLGNVAGRIDHLAIVSARLRVDVPELGNNSIGVVDLTTNRLIRTVGGFLEPQDVGYEPSTDTVYVTNGADGSVRVLRGDDLRPIGRIDLAGDADNLRIDTAHRRVVVGYGKGAPGGVAPPSQKLIAGISPQAPPESFR